MESLIKLSDMCKASLSLEYRERSSCYDTLKEQVEMEDQYFSPDTFLSEEDMKLCIETDKYWTLHFYPDTPIGFYHATASDPKMLVDWALKIMEKTE